MSSTIQTADLDWQIVDGIELPLSKQFGDVYFSKDNGLLETRHVFLNGNDLSSRLANLKDFEYFSIGETGFGTGLNILALWQLWQQVRPNNRSHLHAISVEKYPLSKDDLIRALNAWPELQPLAQQLIQQYPLPVVGCHRLSFPKERFSLDLWLGDVHDVFPIMEKTKPVNAWFLDGFAPSCNPDMWEDNVLNHIIRLSSYGTTFASFSVAGVLKQGLKQHGISISRPRGFGHKREMLKAIWNPPENHQIDLNLDLNPKKTSLNSKLHDKQRQIAIIGAGIAGLSCAWGFAQRGHQVVIYDKSAPLAGGSGNPLAFINPKLCALDKFPEHLMSAAWQPAISFYKNFQAFRAIEGNQLELNDENDLFEFAEQYPQDILTAQTAQQSLIETEFSSLKLLQAGVISPHQLCDQILQHPNIQYQHAEISKVTQQEHVQILTDDQIIAEYDHVIVCAAQQNAQLVEYFPILKPVRGQVSWLNNSHQPLAQDQAYSYGGYCMQLDDDHLILGASFYPDREDTDVLTEDHVHNYELIHNAFPNYAESLIAVEHWQGRASIRVQSQDYFPLLGKLKQDEEIYTLTGLGSKGFLFAPLCSEILMALVLEEACPVSSTLLNKLRATRFQKKVKPKKPYYKPPIS